jgi:tetratricopeptide (TPR) repeat protein
LACTLRGYFDLRGDTGDWMSVARLAVDAAEAEGGPHARAAAEYNFAHVLRATGRRSEAIAHAQRSLESSREAGWDDAESLACAALGMMSIDSGAIGTASKYLNRALDICRRMGNVVGEANALDNLCDADIRLGNLVRAERRLRRALRLYRRIAVPSGEGHALVRLAELLWAFDRDPVARRYALGALTVYRTTGHVVGEGYALATVAAFCPDGAPLDPAIGQAAHAVDLIGRAGDRQFEIHALICLASLHLRADDHRAALTSYTRALALARYLDDPHHQATSLIGLAHVTDGHRGSAHLVEAAGIAAAHGFRVVAADVQTARARALLATGQLATGADAARAAADLHRATGNTRGERRAHDLLARIR